MAKNTEKKGKGFDLYIGEETNIQKEKTEKNSLTKLHCDIERNLKKRIELFKVESEKSIKEIVHDALDEYLKRHDK